MIVLPDFCPTSCRYTPPFHPVQVVRSISGAASRLLYGAKSGQATLEVEYALSDADAAMLLKRFEEGRSSFDRVRLSAYIWKGGSVEVGNSVPPHIHWYFDEPPSVDRLARGRTRVRVTLLGDLPAGT